MRRCVFVVVVFVAVAVFVSSAVAVNAQDRLGRLTYEQCNTAEFFEKIRNGTVIGQYTSANGAVLSVGDTLVLNVPSGSGAVTSVDIDATKVRTNVRAQYSTIIMGRPFSVGGYASGDMQGQVVVIAEMSVHHDGGKKKPLKLTVLLGEPNGRAFGLNKYMSTSDYEASVMLGEIKPLNTPLTRDEAIAKLKEAKDLLDLGLLSEVEYEEKKNELSPVILGK